MCHLRHWLRAPSRHRARNEVTNHRLEAEFHAVVRVIDSLDPVFHERRNFIGRDRSAATAENPDMAGAEFAQTVDHVAKELIVATLVRADRDTVSVLLDGGTHDIVHTAVMAQMDDLDTLRLNEPAHDVDRRVMPVEQRRRRDEAQRRGVGLSRNAGEIAGNRAHDGHPPRIKQQKSPP